MRVQNVSLNNQPQRSQKSKKQNPAFKANILAITKATCHEGTLCPRALQSAVKNFCKKAIDSKNIVPQNIADVIIENHPNGDSKFILLDKTTKLYEKLIKENLLGKEHFNKANDEKIIKHVLEDNKTVKMSFDIKEEEVCPALTVFNTIKKLNNSNNLN